MLTKLHEHLKSHAIMRLMRKRPTSRKRREPKPPEPSGLPATLAEAQERIIQSTVNAWHRQIEEHVTSTGSHEIITAYLLHLLELHQRGGRSGLEPSEIVAMAEGGHPPADHALRVFISRQIEAGQFSEMPVSVQDYARRSLSSAPLPVDYPSQALQVVSNFTRDIAIRMLINMVVARWPEVPRRISTLRHRSAAYYVGVTFSLGERRVARIDEAHEQMAHQLATFMVGYTNQVTDDTGEGR
jgi:hypothetical protein